MRHIGAPATPHTRPSLVSHPHSDPDSGLAAILMVILMFNPDVHGSNGDTGLCCRTPPSVRAASRSTLLEKAGRNPHLSPSSPHSPPTPPSPSPLSQGGSSTLTRRPTRERSCNSRAAHAWLSMPMGLRTCAGRGRSRLGSWSGLG